MKATLIPPLTALCTLLLIFGFEALQKSQENRDLEASKKALMEIAIALQNYTEENGKIPHHTEWTQAIRPFLKKEINDPVFHRIQPEAKTSGWGMNTRMGLRMGSSEKSDQTPLPTDAYPPETILIGPSNTDVITPRRDGKIEQSGPNPQTRLGTLGPIPGKTALYLTTSGEILQMTPKQAEKLFQYKAEPTSERIETQNQRIINARDAELKAIQGNTTKAGNYTILKNGIVATPLIPITPDKTILADLECTSPNPLRVFTRVIFYNKYQKEINYSNTSPQTKVAFPFTEGKYLWTEDQIPNGKEIGFNPHMGHAEGTIKEYKALQKKNKERQAWGTYLLEKTKGRYREGTIVILLDNQRQEQDIFTRKTWVNFPIQVKPGVIPGGTTYFSIEIENKSKTPLVIRNIKIDIQG